MNNLKCQRQVIQSSPAVLLGRVLAADGSTITQSAVSSIVVKVWAVDTNTLTLTLSPTVSTCVYNTLQTDTRWVDDAIGYNLALPVPGSAWPDAGTYQVECKVTPVTGDAFYCLWQLQAVNIYSE